MTDVRAQLNAVQIEHENKHKCYEDIQSQMDVTQTEMKSTIAHVEQQLSNVCYCYC